MVNGVLPSEMRVSDATAQVHGGCRGPAGAGGYFCRL